MPGADNRVPLLYLAPWVDVGGSDKGTIDWFRFLDRDCFRLSLITTQPSANRRLREVTPFAEEVWDLPDLMEGNEFARFILTFIHTRSIRIVHVMNSRLGFELLPDVACLPEPPRVVVQFHVEEPDRSGYVRYVTTRYGNLVDAFSVSSRALSDRLGAYDVPLAKRRLIRTGVNAEREFCPNRVKPVDDLDSGLLHILFPSRVTAQKDPLLMVEVAARLRANGLSFCVHVLGDGELTTAVRERISSAGLENEVVMHGECLDVAPWYAACDLVLLTSAYEGLPYAVYEAMAMATPVVAPELPGIGEVLSPESGILVAPRHDPEVYADAVAALASDPCRRKRMGAAARARARSELSLERMGADHGLLYDELLTSATNGEFPEPAGQHPPTREQPPHAALRRRQPGVAQLVSVIVPCFNHGRYLPACLESVAEQTYDPIETIVVDDGSDDPETLDALGRVEADGTATVVRMATNRGPSAARNAAIERARGRYVLPLDADNVLLPHAVAVLVEQLSSAGERIGFVYPNSQFFGNRNDYYEPPSYNLHALLTSNHCDTSSLIDREVFDRGFRYPEDVVLGHEDWDFVLSLAEHGIYGEPAHAKTLLYRKHGFTRSDLVEAANVSFAEVVARRHPALFDLRRRARLKGEWSPAVSVIALDAIAEGTDDALRNIVAAAASQTCQDFELVIRTARDIWPTELGRRLRRIPSALAPSRAHALTQGLGVANGRYALATYGSPAALLADPALIEKVLRALTVNPHVDALAFASSGRDLPAFRLLPTNDVRSARLGALCWPATGLGAPPSSLTLAGHRPLETLGRWLSAHANVHWREFRQRDRATTDEVGTGPASPIGAPRHDRSRDVLIRASTPPQLPDLPPGVARRIRRPHPWTPPHARFLCRHVHHASGRYVFTNDPGSPPGCSFGYTLGCVRSLPLEGTTALIIRAEGHESAFELGGYRDLDAPELLGFVEQTPLPMFEALQIGRHRQTGQHVLIAGLDDPLAAMIDQGATVGYIEPHPIHPRESPQVDAPYGMAGLIRAIDLDARCHRYGVGHLPAGRLVGELGALFSEPTGDCEPVWIDGEGRLLAARDPCHNGRPMLRSAVRWTGAPLTWSRVGGPRPKARAAARRAYESARILTSRPSPGPVRPSDPAGYLLRSATSNTVPLYAATHPVTGDQLLSTAEAEPRLMGYREVVLLGHLVARAPMTGTLGLARVGVPWASRFGLVDGTS